MISNIIAAFIGAVIGLMVVGVIAVLVCEALREWGRKQNGKS